MCKKLCKPLGAAIVALVIALATVMAMPVTFARAADPAPASTGAWKPAAANDTYTFDGLEEGTGCWAAMQWDDTVAGEVSSTDAISGKSLRFVKEGSSDFTTVNYKILQAAKCRITFDIKLVGSKGLNICIQGWSNGYIILKEGGVVETSAATAAANIDLDNDLDVTYNKTTQVFHVSFTNLAQTANASGDSMPFMLYAYWGDTSNGFVIDNFTMQYPMEMTSAYSVALNLADSADVGVYCSAAFVGSTVETVAVGGETLDESLYSVDGDYIMIDRSVFDGMSKGQSKNIVITDSEGTVATTVIKAHRFAVDSRKGTLHDFEAYEDGTASFAAGKWDSGEKGFVTTENVISGQKSLRMTEANNLAHYSFTDGNVCRVSLKFKFDGATEFVIAGGNWNSGQIVVKPNVHGYTSNGYDPAGGLNIDPPNDAVDFRYDERTGVYTVGYTDFGANDSAKFFLSNVIGGGLILDDIQVEYRLGLEVSPRKATVNTLIPEDLAIETNIDVLGAEIASVKVGNDTLEADEYTVTGSTVTVKKEYLQTLNAGNHTLTIADSLSNEAEVTIEVPAIELRAMKSLTVNLSDESDVAVYHEAADILTTIAGVSVDGAPLTAQQYTAEGNAVRIAAEVFAGKTSGNVVLTDSDSHTATVPYKTFRFAVDEAKTTTMDFENYTAGDRWEKTGWASSAGNDKVVVTDTASEIIDGKSLRISSGGTNSYRDNCFPTVAKTLIEFDLKFIDATYARFWVTDFRNGYVDFRKDGTVVYDEQNHEHLNIDQNRSLATIAKDGDVYRCRVLSWGQGANTTLSFIHDGTAIVVDNIVGKFELGLGLVDSVSFNRSTPQDVVIPYNNVKLGTTIAAVTLDGAPLTADTDYTVAADRITVKKETLAKLAAGNHTVVMTDSAGSEATTVVNVTDLEWDGVYSQSFDGLDASKMTGGGDSEAYFWAAYENMLSIEAVQADCTVVAAGGGQALKFVPTSNIGANATYTAVAANGNKTTMLTAGREYALSFLYKGYKTTGFGVRILFYQSKALSGLDADISGEMYTVSGNVETGEIRATVGSGFANDRKHPLSGSSIEPLEDGWYRITVIFGFREGDFGHEQAMPDIVNAFFVTQGVKTTDDSYILLDDLQIRAECYPYASTDDTIVFDTARQNDLQVTLHLHDRYTVTEVSNTTDATPAPLTRGDDYTFENGVVTFKKQYLATLTTGTYTYALATDKGNAVTVTLTVLDSTPSVEPATADFEKGAPNDVTFDIDFKGYAVDLVYLNEEMVEDVNYQVNDSVTKLTFKRGYLSKLAEGSHIFELLSSSGVTVRLTVTVTDFRPAFESAAASYDKTSADGLTVALDTKGKSVTRVKLGETVLDVDDYTVTEGNLTIGKAAFESVYAGVYTLTVTTDCGTASIELTVLDIPPTASVDTETASASSDLVITLDTKGRDIVSIVVGEFALTSDDYTYENGKLTVHKELIAELAAGEKKVVITTAGGRVEVTFTVTAPVPTPTPAPTTGDENTGCGCHGSIAVSSFLLTVVSAAVCALFLLRRRTAE